MPAGRRGVNPLVGWLGRLSLSIQATSLCWLRVTPGAGRSRGLLSDRHQFNRLVRSKAVDVVDNPLRLVRVSRIWCDWSPNWPICGFRPA